MELKKCIEDIIEQKSWDIDSLNEEIKSCQNDIKELMTKEVHIQATFLPSTVKRLADAYNKRREIEVEITKLRYAIAISEKEEGGKV